MAFSLPSPSSLLKLPNTLNLPYYRKLTLVLIRYLRLTPLKKLHYLQIHRGTAMGTRMAPSYANLFLAKFETDALLRAPFQPYIWWRFIDDIFMIWTHSLDDLQTFTTYLNNIHPTIKFTSNHSFTPIPFLDVSVSLCNGTITTDLCTKATDKHQYLLQSSCHPKHTKRAIPFSLTLRLRRQFVLLTTPSHSALTNSKRISTNVDTIYLSSTKK